MPKNTGIELRDCDINEPEVPSELDASLNQRTVCCVATNCMWEVWDSLIWGRHRTADRAGDLGSGEL